METEKGEIQFYLIRHGESEANAYPGVPRPPSHDTPLTKLGRFQAERLGKRFLKEKILFDDIYTSTLKRSEETCLIASKKFGFPAEKIIKDTTLIEHFHGEPLLDAGERFSRFIEDIILKNPDLEYKSRIVIFSHGTIIKCFLRHIIEADESLIHRLSIDNASISKLIYRPSKQLNWQIKGINDTSHLYYLT